jgi:phosphatidylethanolamine/phosphatidyl-N-methylethanolamine N-methyltransferase
MPEIVQSSAANTTIVSSNVRPNAANPGMFFRRWLANPLQMGSIVPSSPALCERIVRQTQRVGNEVVLELGGRERVSSRAPCSPAAFRPKN